MDLEVMLLGCMALSHAFEKAEAADNFARKSL